MCICHCNPGRLCRAWERGYCAFFCIHAGSSVHLDHVILADISWKILSWRRIDEYRFYIPSSHDMWVESCIYLFFTPSLFNDGIVSYNSSRPSLQIPPLALPRGRHRQGACFFLRDNCHLSYQCREHVFSQAKPQELVFKPQELRSYVIEFHIVLFLYIPMNDP